MTHARSMYDKLSSDQRSDFHRAVEAEKDRLRRQGADRLKARRDKARKIRERLAYRDPSKVTTRKATPQEQAQFEAVSGQGPVEEPRPITRSVAPLRQRKKHTCAGFTKTKSKNGKNPCRINADRLRDGRWFCHVHDPQGASQQNLHARSA